MKRFFKHHGLSVVLVMLFLGIWVGQAFTGLREHNQDNREHGQPQVALSEYLGSGHFWEATAENWESEFLQMGAFIILTVFLYQKGSAESKDPDREEAVDSDPAEDKDNPKAPWPVRKGGFVMRIYCYSLSLTFLLLFLISFFIHAAAGARVYSQDQIEHGQQAVSTWAYMATSRFWFESLQNWQSEFLSILAMVVLTIFLRQQGSPESKAVAVPHWESEEQWEEEKESKEKEAQLAGA